MLEMMAMAFSRRSPRSTASSPPVSVSRATRGESAMTIVVWRLEPSEMAAHRGESRKVSRKPSNAASTTHERTSFT